MEKVSLSFKVEQRLKEALEALAAKDNRSLSNYVITVLLKHVEEKGSISSRDRKAVLPAFPCDFLLGLIDSEHERYQTL